jgi:Ca2+-binding EF-hand superfamily protein
MKLSFAFSVFDTRPEMRKKKKDVTVVNSLSGEDLFLFLRSILIVTFSCCRQSLDMTDDVVSQCIAETANMICNDVMRHQWETKQADRCNFDEFGQWYNDGGFERAPWLELLDLTKWVLADGVGTVEKHSPALGMPSMHPAADTDIPPPPPEDELDPSFFEESGLMPMDSVRTGAGVVLCCVLVLFLIPRSCCLQMDEMDIMLMPQPSTDREVDGNGVRITKSFSFSSPRSRPLEQDAFAPPSTPTTRGSPLMFHLITREPHGGYRVSCSRARIDRFRRVLDACGLQNTTVEDACNAVLSKSSRQTKSETESKLTKEGFQAALKLVSSWRPKSSSDNQRTLTGLFDSIFSAFDRDGTGRPSVIEVACGVTVLCQGKKSDKLEYAFEVLDKNKRGLLSKQDMSKYIQSFLTVLLSVALSPSLSHDPSFDTLSTMDGGRCETSIAAIQQAVAAGAEWATEQAFRDFDGGRKKNSSMSFDDFAEWYTSKGFGSIPWLELIDLRKWTVTP